MFRLAHGLEHAFISASGRSLLGQPCSSSYTDQATEPSALLKNADVTLSPPVRGAAASHGSSPKWSPGSSAHCRSSDTYVTRSPATASFLFSPKIDLVSGRFFGFEALLRSADQGKLRSPPPSRKLSMTRSCRPALVRACSSVAGRRRGLERRRGTLRACRSERLDGRVSRGIGS